MNREKIYVALFDILQTYLKVITIYDEETTIAAIPYAPVWIDRYEGDVSVVTDTGTVLINVSPNAPAQGEYCVTNGAYSFNAADINTNVKITYDFTGIITFSRFLQNWSDVAPAEQPAMFLTMGTQNNNKQRGLKNKWMLNFNLFIYVNTTNLNNIIPATMMNPILDQVDKMFTPDDIADYVLTLGGLVSHAAIQGDVQTDEGLLGAQAFAVVPIEILVPT
jgi:hypothetical protein